MRIAAWLLCAALLLAACGDGDDGARVVSGPRTIELNADGSTAVVERDPFRIAFGGAALVAAGDPAGVELDVDTSEGEIARVRLRFDSPRSLAISVDPFPDDDTVLDLWDHLWKSL